MIRYFTIAGGLGFGWFFVLLIPNNTRGWFLQEVPWSIGLLVSSGVIAAFAFRGFIRTARTFQEHLWRAITIPYAACAFYLTLWSAKLWIHDLIFGGLANLHDTIALYFWGLLSAAWAFPVVIPFGLVCQYVMNWVANSVPGTRAA